MGYGLKLWHWRGGDVSVDELPVLLLLELLKLVLVSRLPIDLLGMYDGGHLLVFHALRIKYKYK
jgi:hypothetical protein